ncbi:unnamed protein product [Mytilus edulis]|uniref:Peptidase C1A papain C-terminal domain-containing protein n=1 Tax=Mytilus edulis TaxID=6550 RepID=A0A8S3QDD8_MYTED|nr:unnamed protein product [Mytilus edulis]
MNVFGNSPSTAGATYGLRRTVQHAELDVKEFVSKDVYVDDGLPLVQLQRELLISYKKLNKLYTTTADLDDLAKNLKDLDLGSADLPMQRSLGLSWDTELDEFPENLYRRNPEPITRGCRVNGIEYRVGSVFTNNCTVYVFIAGGCRVNGIEYRVGSVFTNNCNQCTCRRNPSNPNQAELRCTDEVCLVQPDMIQLVNNANYGWGVERQSSGVELKYWLGVNSWGTSWGEGGYLKIGRGIDECKVESCIVSSWGSVSSAMITEYIETIQRNRDP